MMDKIKEWWNATPYKVHILIGVVAFLAGAILF